VFKEANGGHSWMTAYWVIYVSDKLADEMSKINLYDYSSIEARGDPQILSNHYYSDFINGPIRMHVSN
jgi:hypothetical protein